VENVIRSSNDFQIRTTTYEVIFPRGNSIKAGYSCSMIKQIISCLVIAYVYNIYCYTIINHLFIDVVPYGKMKKLCAMLLLQCGSRK